MQVLVYIRDGIKEAQPRESSLICSVIELETIKEQIERGVFDWARRVWLVSSVVEVIRRAQDPTRADELETRWRVFFGDMMAAAGNLERHPIVFCRVLEFLHTHVTKMRVDSINARIRAISQMVVMGGMDFERDMFQTKLGNGSLSLRVTEVSGAFFFFVSVSLCGCALMDCICVFSRHGCALSSTQTVI
jgi:hypothetical protein